METIIKFAAAVLSVFFICNTYNIVNHSSAIDPYPFESESEIGIRSSDTVWLYKTVDGKTYRRLYDLNKQKWIGDWELCP